MNKSMGIDTPPRSARSDHLGADVRRHGLTTGRVAAAAAELDAKAFEDALATLGTGGTAHSGSPTNLALPHGSSPAGHTSLTAPVLMPSPRVSSRPSVSGTALPPLRVPAGHRTARADLPFGGAGTPPLNSTHPIVVAHTTHAGALAAPAQNPQAVTPPASGSPVDGLAPSPVNVAPSSGGIDAKHGPAPAPAAAGAAPPTAGAPGTGGRPPMLATTTTVTTTTTTTTTTAAVDVTPRTHARLHSLSHMQVTHKPVGGSPQQTTGSLGSGKPLPGAAAFGIKPILGVAAAGGVSTANNAAPYKPGAAAGTTQPSRGRLSVFGGGGRPSVSGRSGFGGGRSSRSPSPTSANLSDRSPEPSVAMEQAAAIPVPALVVVDTPRSDMKRDEPGRGTDLMAGSPRALARPGAAGAQHHHHHLSAAALAAGGGRASGASPAHASVSTSAAGSAAVTMPPSPMLKPVDDA